MYYSHVKTIQQAVEIHLMFSSHYKIKSEVNKINKKFGTLFIYVAVGGQIKRFMIIL